MSFVPLIKQLLGGRPLDKDALDTMWRDHLSKPPYSLRFSLDKNRSHLVMFHTTPASDRTNPVVRECNGLIINRDDLSIVVRGLDDFVPLSSFTELSLLLRDLQEEKVPVQLTEDGTVLRVTYLRDTKEWLVSTNRRIDASRVKWSCSKSFVDMLAETVVDAEEKLHSIFERDLSKDKTHIFILLHPANPHVIEYQTPELVAVASRSLLDFAEHELSVSWARPAVKENISKRDLKGVSERLFRDKKRGLLYTRDGIRYMCDGEVFVKICNLRKNQPTMSQSYLACNDVEKKQLLQYYPHWKDVFSMLETRLSQLVWFSFGTYKQAYIQRRFHVPMDHPVYHVMKLIHWNYKRTKEPADIETVRGLVRGMDASLLFWLLQLDLPSAGDWFPKTHDEAAEAPMKAPRIPVPRQIQRKKMLRESRG